MRAFAGQFDHVSLQVLGLGAAIGVVWLVALDLGMAIAGLTLLVGSVALIVHHRWIEIALLMIGVGLVVTVGYWVLGAPPEPPLILDPDVLEGYGAPIVAEVFAPGMAALILAGGVVLAAVVGAWDVWEGRRRQRLDERHRRRRGQKVPGSTEG
jgi:hypothetical protein